MYFRDVNIGDTFYCNGNMCIKHSSSTALLACYGRIFYFALDTKVY